MKKNKDKKIGIIYVISQARFIEGTTSNDLIDGKFEYKPCIKIGFTEDKENRFIQYRCNCVSTIKLFTISDETITKEDESRLHEYFKKYKVKDRRGKEWFDWNDEIIEFFQTYTNISDIRNFLDSQRIFVGESKVPESSINFIVNIISDVIYGGPNLKNIEDIKRMSNILNDTYFLNEDDIFDYLEFDLGIEKDKVGRIRKKYDGIREDEKMFSSYLEEFNKKPTYIDKLKYLCESVKLSGTELDRFLDFIPLSFKNAYLVFGPTKLKSLSYKKSRIEEEYELTKNNQSSENDLTKEIYSSFIIGEKYSKEFIKSNLKEIYNRTGYKKTPKANDLEKWFDMKSGLLNNKETGKRDHCFEIISKK